MADDYNPTKLDAELKAAGLNIAGCSSKGRVDWIGTPTAQELSTADQVKQNHEKRDLRVRVTYSKTAEDAAMKAYEDVKIRELKTWHDDAALEALRVKLGAAKIERLEGEK